MTHYARSNPANHTRPVCEMFWISYFVCMVATVICALTALCFLVDIFHNRESNDTIINQIGLIFLVFFMWIGGCVFAVLSIRQLLHPFSQDLNDPLRENLLLEC